MNQLNFVQVTQEYDQVKKRVNNLKFQLKDIDQKNYLLQAKIKDLRQITPHKQKSPITQLQEQLHLDRKQIIEQFKPIIEKEGIYLRNERMKTENYLIQSKIWDIQQKKMKVKQIDDFEAEASKRRAMYQEKKIKEVRQRQLQEMETNRINTNKRIQEIKELKKYETELQDLIQKYTNHPILVPDRKNFNYAIDFDTSVVLPSIQKSNSRMSQNSNQKTQTKGHSPFQKSGKIFDRLQKSDIKNDVSMSEFDQDKRLQGSRKKSQSIDHLNMACQTSFLVSEKQNQESVQYTMHYDSYFTKHKDQTIEKSMTNEISEEINQQLE